MSLLHKISSSCCTVLSHIPEPIFSWRFVFQRDERVLSPERRRDLENRIAKLAIQMGVNKKLYLLERRNMGEAAAQAQGMTKIPGRAGIAIHAEYFDELFDENNIEEIDFILAHEIGHITQNWLPAEIALGTAIPVTAVIIAVAMLILCPPTLPIIIAAVALCTLTLAVGMPGMVISQIAFSRRNEKQADRAAFEACSKSTTRTVIANLKESQRYLQRKRNEERRPFLKRLWRKITISPQGNNRLDLFHPSLSQQIAYLEDGACNRLLLVRRCTVKEQANHCLRFQVVPFGKTDRTRNVRRRVGGSATPPP
jgi:Zn-dependent protease with chaperone function